MKRRITKQAAKKFFADGKTLVYFCPCKMRPEGPFSQAVGIAGAEYLESAKRYEPATYGETPLWKGNLTDTAWSLAYNNWAYYNATYETGYYAHYYIES